MKYDWKMELYWRLPVRVQEIALGVYARHLESIYYGPGYEEFKQFLYGTRDLSAERLEEWVNMRLTHVIRTAATKVPYYRNLFKSLDWWRIKNAGDLKTVPCLDKQSIRMNEHHFLADDLAASGLWMEKTSGTTGTSLKIYWPMDMVPKWWAITEVMCRKVAGVSQEMPRATVSGRPVVRGDTIKPPFWRYNRHWKQLYLSSYHISLDTTSAYTGALNNYKSLWMTGYGSTIASLAENALKTGIEPHAMKAVVVSGDTLTAGMRESIEKFFKCKCYDHYGQCEGVAMAMECRYGNMHIVPMTGIIEILREDGSSCGPGELGVITATTLLNDAMPLIRYNTGDYAAWATSQKCHCGNNNPIICGLEGRVDDYLLTHDGRKIGRISTAMKRSQTIHSAQLVQDRPGHAYLLARPGKGYSRADALAVCRDIRERIGKFELEIIEVPEIPKTPQGKTKLVIRLDESASMEKVYASLLNGRRVEPYPASF